MNHLEQLTAEWYEFTGYFVRRNVLVGKRAAGGHECELDVVAFNPKTKHLVHVEPSLDAHTWKKRELRFLKKFEAGRRHIPSLFDGIDLPITHDAIEQIALLGYGSTRSRTHIGGGRIMLIPELLSTIFAKLDGKKLATAAVPEQFPLLRTLQLVAEHRLKLFRSPINSN